MNIECIFCGGDDVMLFKGVYCACQTCSENWIRVEVRDGESEQQKLDEAFEILEKSK